LDVTFVPRHQLGKKSYSHEAPQFLYLQKMFKKITTKIQTVGTCPKSHLSAERTMVLYGLTKNSRRETQYQIPLDLRFGVLRSFVLSFFQTPTPSLALHTLYDSLHNAKYLGRALIDNSRIELI